MAANDKPTFVLTPNIGQAQIATANANRDGTGTLGDVLTAGTNGTRVDKITVHATVTTTAGMVRLYLYDGTNTRLWKEIPVSAITVTASAAGFESELTSGTSAPLLVLPASWHLKASTHNAETFNVFAHGGDF